MARERESQQQQQVSYTVEQLVAVNPYNPDILTDLENHVNEQVFLSLSIFWSPAQYRTFRGDWLNSVVCLKKYGFLVCFTLLNWLPGNVLLNDTAKIGSFELLDFEFGYSCLLDCKDAFAVVGWSAPSSARDRDYSDYIIITIVENPLQEFCRYIGFSSLAFGLAKPPTMFHAFVTL